jgi:predicted GIY-YIG superfamily endonuclease
MFVYCLATVDEPIRTYIGATINLEKRLSQHNGLLSGGARATSVRVNEWYRICYVKGFSSWKQSLSFEWHWKHFGRRIKKYMSPLERRKESLSHTLEWAERIGMENLEVIFE